MHVTHIRLMVDHFAETFAFYREVLGLPTGYPPDSAGPYAEFELGGEHYLALFDRALMFEAIGRDDGFPSVADDRIAVVVAVDDVDVEEQRLRGLGIPVVAGATNRPAWGLRTVHVRDPEGNLVELYTGIPE